MVEADSFAEDQRFMFAARTYQVIRTQVDLGRASAIIGAVRAFPVTAASLARLCDEWVQRDDICIVMLPG